MTWITTHWDSLLGILGLIITAAGRIADLTPSESDNKAINAALKAIQIAGLKVGPMDPKEVK